MSRNFWIILVVIAVGMVGLVMFTSGDDDSKSDVTKIVDAKVIQDSDYATGSADAKVSIIEYGDFGCPGCGVFFSTLVGAKAKYGDDIHVAFRHFPLIQLHRNAMAAHRAVEAAGNQDKFWEMHDMIYQRQAEWSQQSATQSESIDILKGYADELGLDMDQYAEDVISSEAFDEINAHIESGQTLNITGTPTILLNGEIIDTPRSVEEFSVLIDEAMNSSDKEEQSADSEANAEPEAKPEEDQESN